MEGLLLLLFLLVPIILGTPIAFSLGIAGILGIIFFLSPNQLTQVTSIVLSNSTSNTLLVAPMFIIMAEILIISGISGDLFNAARKWLSRLPGGLAITAIAACSGFAAVTGSSGATVATIGSMSVPEMLKQKYSVRLAAGSVVSGGTLGILIPPSMALIIYGVTNEVSISKLFIAGIIPGIIVAILLSIAIVIYSKMKPENAPGGESYSWKQRWFSLITILPILVISFIIIISMYTGIATPTESAGLGVVASLITAGLMRRLTWENLKIAMLKSAKTSSMVLLLIIGGMTFGFVVGYLNIPEQIVSSIQQLDLNRWMVLTLFIVILLIMGCFLDPISMILLTMPFMFPVIVQLGFDPIWFGIIVTITCEIGMITPPVGMNLFVLKSVVPEIKLNDIIIGSAPFILVLMLAIVLFVFFPQFVTMLI
ncbi:TRAP transporter large permease [Neobacillus niacini]|uniref:TRAP transporter large permease n=1 Tax=Neobacillus niacini TaxID=86668 RepID=UPI0030018066